MGIRHAKTDGRPNDPDHPERVGGEDWDDAHVGDPTILVGPINVTQATAALQDPLGVTIATLAAGSFVADVFAIVNIKELGQSVAIRFDVALPNNSNYVTCWTTDAGVGGNADTSAQPDLGTSAKPFDNNGVFRVRAGIDGARLRAVWVFPDASVFDADLYAIIANAS